MATKIQAGTTVRDGVFDGSDFSRQNLSECTFDNCSFIGCSFRACELDYTHFTRCEFNDEAAQSPADFCQAHLREVRFNHCNLTVVEFIRAHAYGLELQHCHMQGCDLSHSDFRLPVGDSDLASLTMNHCNFSYGNLANTYLVGCALTDNRMLEACLDYCDLSDADLSGSTLHNLSGRGMTLTGVDLRGAQFNTINAARIDLSGVKIYTSQVADILSPLGIEISPDP
ncbi:MAG: pentapeptide repeat-containing protein [Pseudomonadota bacterium]